MKLVTTEAVMTALCQHCDSHIEMREECGMREIMNGVPSAWIKCSERLPEDGNYVLGYMAYGQCSVLKCEGGRLYTAGCWVPLPKNAVTHWMPLPDAPEVEG